MSPFVSKAQAKYLYAKHPKVAKEFASHTKSIKTLPAHHSGKGTRARLNTAAYKMFFGTKHD